jgi:hypothetical protein
MRKQERDRETGEGTKKRKRVPGLRISDVVAVVCSDMHLSHKPPVARSAEPDWYTAMARTLEQLTILCEKHDCPLIIAGDIFDKWNAPAQLINFAMEYLPEKVYAIPGQHDMPYHEPTLLDRSAYRTLTKANRIWDLMGWPRILLRANNLHLYGFEWQRPLSRPDKEGLPIAIIHAYIWTRGYTYPGAEKNKHINEWWDRLDHFGYKVAFFGDNHKGFYFDQCRSTNQYGCTIMNCGTLMRRKIDEINYTPTVGLLHRGGYFTAHYLDCSEDKFIDVEQAMSMVERGIDLGDFVGELAELADTGINFLEAVKQFLNDNGISKRIKNRVLQTLERDKDD